MPTQRQLLIDALDAGTTNVHELHERLRMPIRSVRHHINRLRAEGHIDADWNNLRLRSPKRHILPCEIRDVARRRALESALRVPGPTMDPAAVQEIIENARLRECLENDEGEFILGPDGKPQITREGSYVKVWYRTDPNARLTERAIREAKMARDMGMELESYFGPLVARDLNKQGQFYFKLWTGTRTDSTNGNTLGNWRAFNPTKGKVYSVTVID